MRLTLFIPLLIAAHVALQAQSPILPDPKLTPGATVKIAFEKLCAPGYASSVRNVPQSEKNEVYAEYGITEHPAGAFEVDHLISLELGGSNDIKNLWPQSYFGEWNAHVKDKLENRLHVLVCSGKMTLAEAQTKIAADWIALYKKVFVTDGPQ